MLHSMVCRKTLKITLKRTSLCVKFLTSFLLSSCVGCSAKDLDRLIRQSLKIDGHLAEFDVPHKKRNPDLFHDPLDDFGAGAYQGPGDLSGSGWLAPSR